MQGPCARRLLYFLGKGIVMAYDLSNPRYVREDTSLIDVIWNHPRLGEIPYTVANNFGEEEMQEIWDELMAGLHGPIAPYEPPVTE